MTSPQADGPSKPEEGSSVSQDLRLRIEGLLSQLRLNMLSVSVGQCADLLRSCLLQFQQDQEEIAIMEKALREVRHHADDECGFMVSVLAALERVEEIERLKTENKELLGLLGSTGRANSESLKPRREDM